MKKFCGSIFLAGCLVFSLSAQLIDETLVKVSLIRDDYITSVMLNTRLRMMENLSTQLNANLDITQDQMIELLINEILVKQAATREKITVSEAQITENIAKQKAYLEQAYKTKVTDQEYKDYVFSKMGLSWEEYRENVKITLLQSLLVDKLKKSVLAAVPKPTEDEILEFYYENVQSFTNSIYVRYSHLFISTYNLSADDKKQAYENIRSIQKKYQNGENTFENLIKEYSEDTTTKYKAGDYGYVTFTNTDLKTIWGEKFFTALFKTPLNQVTGIVESNLGYHMIRVTEKITPKLPGLDDPASPVNKTTVREIITQRLQVEKETTVRNGAIEAMIQDLRKEAKIVYYTESN